MNQDGDRRLNFFVYNILYTHYHLDHTYTPVLHISIAISARWPKKIFSDDTWKFPQVFFFFAADLMNNCDIYSHIQKSDGLVEIRGA